MATSLFRVLSCVLVWAPLPVAAQAPSTPPAAPQDADTTSTIASPPADVAAFLRSRGTFTEILGALEATELIEVIAGPDPVTFFAPTDAAVARLPAEVRRALLLPENTEELAALLRFHLVRGALTLADIATTARVASLHGRDLALRQIDDDLYSIDVARLVEVDIACGHSVVHVIDEVLIPPGLDLVTEFDIWGGGVQTYEIDGEHSSILFRVLHTEIGVAWGWFGAFEGRIRVDSDEPSHSSIVIAVDVTSVDTRSEARDRYLQSADFFDTGTHAAATFRSTAVELLEDGALRITGELTLRGVPREVTFDARKVGEGRFGNGGYRIGYEAEVPIRRSDFGMTFGIPGVAGDEVTLVVALEGTRELAPDADRASDR